MNNLKFRAWDKEDKYMEYTDKNLVVCFSDEGVDAIDHTTFSHSCTSMQNYELMMSMGMKDKNGTEIYEGDIVRYDRGISYSVEKFPFIVKFNGNTFVFKYGFIQHNLFENMEYVTVIGNIYENVDLLERDSDE